jgi:hypothetical protein
MLKAVRVALTLILLALPLWAQQLKLRFLDVGQGDAIRSLLEPRSVA